jgi:hypothetical protein
MAKAEKTVLELVSAIERRELVLPEMQREYVWTGPQVRDLLDSLYRGYPSGVILTWQTNDAVELSDFAVATDGPKSGNPMLLLDGQQRLTSLSAVIRGIPIEVKKKNKPIEILFNLEHPDTLSFSSEVKETLNDDELVDLEAPDASASDNELMKRISERAFVISNRKLTKLQNWVSVTEIFSSEGDGELLKKAGITSFEDSRYSKYSKRIQQVRNIKNYTYRLDILEASLSYDEVTEIFVRVNSKGATLRGSDLALAQITAKWKGSLAIFRGYQEHSEKLGFDFSTGLIVKSLVSFATSQSEFKIVHSLDAETLQSAWKETTIALDFAFNYIKTNVGISHSSLLSSPFIVITTAFWASKRNYRISDSESRAMRKWLLLANAKGRYSRGSSETFLNQDLATLRDGFGPDQLLSNLAQQVGSLEFSSTELIGKTARSGIFKTMFIAFKSDSATDWWTGLQISPTHAGKRNQIQHHHIFPKKFIADSLEGVPARQVDDLANLAFISANTNIRISDKNPEVYLASIVEKNPTALALQQVPRDSSVWEAQSFSRFLEERRALIVQRLNNFVESA